MECQRQPCRPDQELIDIAFVGRHARLRTLCLVSAFGLSLSGCAPALEPGSVAVEIRSVLPVALSGEYDVRIVGPDGAVIFSRDMGAGHSLSYGDVPLGWVSVSAQPLCTVEAELTADHPTIGLIVDGSHCTLTDGNSDQSSP